MFLLYRICVCFSHFDDVLQLSIFVPMFDGVEWGVATVPEHSEMISLATRDGNVAESTTRSRSRGRFLRRRTHHVTIMKPDGTTVQYFRPWARWGKCAPLQHDTYLHR